MDPCTKPIVDQGAQLLAKGRDLFMDLKTVDTHDHKGNGVSRLIEVLTPCEAAICRCWIFLLHKVICHSPIVMRVQLGELEGVFC